MTTSLETMIAELKARQDIHDVLVRYCRAVDQCDVELIRSCFHADAIDDHGFFNGPAHEFAERSAANLSSMFVSTRHYMTNEYVELSGTTAKCETFVLCNMRMEKEDGKYDVTAHCRYLDRFECRDGIWKIAFRQLVSDGTRVDKVDAEHPNLDRGARGTRGPDDPGNRFFA